MDIDTLKKQIQDFFQEGTVTIVGSGLSTAEGIPGMGALAEVLMLHMPEYLSEENDKGLWNKIAAELQKKAGLENALHDFPPSEHLEDCIRKITAQVITRAEEFVIHDVIAHNRILRFSNYISRFNIRNTAHTVITTNYDRLIEYACEAVRLRVDTLFVGKYLAHFEPEQSKYMFCSGVAKRGNRHIAEFAPRVTVLKPHGCLSWQMIGGEPYATPLKPTDHPLIITPGVNKYREGYGIPFDHHRIKANAAIDNAKQFVIIGYGFGDEHLETHLVQRLNNGVPALILAKHLTAKAENMIAPHRRICAICEAPNSSSKVITEAGDFILPGVNLWDIDELIKEVF